ncbi:MAG: S8 family serine peptidase, partial [Acidobacteriota bacterium]|nr:S8 family serine peptidase [Acidobacteriota bacterium]
MSSEGSSILAGVEDFGADEIVEGLRLVRVEPGETAAAIEALRARDDVLYAEPNYVRRAMRAPDDAQYAAQWGLKNATTPGFDVEAEAAWDVTTGSRDVVVGVIDEGLDVNHPDLSSNVWRNAGEIGENGVDDDGDGYVDDVNGYDFFHNDPSVFDGAGDATNKTDAHGTHVAGIVGAVGGNGAGVVGVNWQVSLMSLKFLGPNGGRSSDLLRAFAYAKTMRERGVNLRVLNNSYGGYGRSQAELDAINALSDAGILFVAAAGNDASDNDLFPTYPANYDAPNVISVAAASSDRSVQSSTNYGARTVHLFAPGSSVLSTTPNGTYGSLSGTSMAAPFVAGAAALVCAAHPEITTARLRAALIYSGPAYDSGTRKTITGRSLSVAAALRNAAASDTNPPAPISDFRVDASAAHAPLEVPLLWTATGDDGNSGRAAVLDIRFSDGDPRDPAVFAQARRLVSPPAADAGMPQSATVRIPYQHQSGFIGIRAIDDAGNASPVTAVSVSADQLDADPYIVGVGPTEPISTGGTPLIWHFNDAYSYNYALPFTFPYFGKAYSYVTVSTNGVLYFTDRPPILSNNAPADAYASAERLAGAPRIAGLWDDLRTDRGGDIYVVKPDPTRITFRWQGVTAARPMPDGTTRGELPVNFDIELTKDGTITVRYGDGNTQLLPVVGLSAGEPDAYVVASHTSESAPKSLTNAPLVRFTPRRLNYVAPPPPTPTPTPTADAELRMSAAPAAVTPGQQITYHVDFSILGANGPVPELNVTLPLPQGTTFLSCSAGANCSAPPVGSNGAVTVSIKNPGGNLAYSFTVNALVTAQPGTTLTATATASVPMNDYNPLNNSA